MSSTLGKVSCEGMSGEWAIDTDAGAGGMVSLNDQTGWSPPTAAIVSRMRDPAR